MMGEINEIRKFMTDKKASVTSNRVPLFAYHKQQWSNTIVDY